MCTAVMPCWGKLPAGRGMTRDARTVSSRQSRSSESTVSPCTLYGVDWSVRSEESCLN